MKRTRAVLPILFSAALAFGQPAHSGQVFKCASDGGRATYQALPCPTEGDRIELRAHDPEPGERAAAHKRARKERRFVEAIEAEREAARRSAQAQQDLRDTERQSHETRCASYVERAERAEADARMHVKRNRYKRDHELRARTLRDRHFTECFAAG
ncbi:hypothetical protein [Azoarcus sp. DN11]|uniref:hypothetical protein n=1 Tax=Azoarcus sp. DN11 TaxID=356837 RepID=UPI000FE1D139|nr:hypothetical protein [Azoarcus sp. DN11]